MAKSRADLRKRFSGLVCESFEAFGAAIDQTSKGLRVRAGQESKMKMACRFVVTTTGV